MRLLDLLETITNTMLAEAYVGYHGSASSAPHFTPTNTGTNSTTFGAYQTMRTGVFFSDNPDFAAMYGQVAQYQLNIDSLATDLLNKAFDLASSLDAHDPDQRPLWITLMGIARSGPEWELFDGEVGEAFVPWLVDQGYDSAQFEEYNEDDHGEEHRSITTVVFNPANIRPIASESRIDEMPTFNANYSKHQDMPIPLFPDEIKSLRKIASNGTVDIYWNQKDADAYVVPVGRHKADNVGYLHAYDYDRMAAHHKGLNFPSPLVVTDVFISPEYRGGTGVLIYKAIMDQGHTMVSATTLTADSIGLWQSLARDPRVVVWAMDKRGSEVYPVVANPNGRIEPQGVDFEHAVLFASTKINPIKSSVTESFFADNMDVMMPVVRSLMKTAARPLIYKLWKKSPNSVLALAAIKRLHDKGDENPIWTLYNLSDIDVPMQFLKRLAWDAGLHDITGVSSSNRKPGLMPMSVSESSTQTVYHATLADNLKSIKMNGLEPRIGTNSQAIGETEPAVYVFFDWASMEDAVGNWEMDWHEDEDAELIALTLEVPAEWLSSRWNNRTSGEGMITQHIPPSMIKAVKRNF